MYVRSGILGADSRRAARLSNGSLINEFRRKILQSQRPNPISALIGLRSPNLPLKNTTNTAHRFPTYASNIRHPSTKNQGGVDISRPAFQTTTPAPRSEAYALTKSTTSRHRTRAPATAARSGGLGLNAARTTSGSGCQKMSRLDGRCRSPC